MSQPGTKTPHQWPGIFKTFGLFLCQAIPGAGLTWLTMYLAYYHCDFIPAPSPSLAGSNSTVELSIRLAYALRCTFPMVLVVYGGFLMVACVRSVTDAINPLSGNEHLVEVEKRFLTNTLEQFVISSTLMMIVASFSSTPEELKLLPIYAAAFTVGRVAFYLGYRIHPLYRSVGTSSSIASQCVLLWVACHTVWTRGMLYELGDVTPFNFVKTEL